MGQMPKAVRSLISVLFIAGGVYVTFAVPLAGGRTFAQHVDEIGQTPEAEELLDDARESINPALDEVKQRVLGEYVEAPTTIPSADGSQPSDEPESGPEGSGQSIYASGLEDFDAEPGLPGR